MSIKSRLSRALRALRGSEAAQPAVRPDHRLVERLSAFAADLASASDLPAIYRAVLAFARQSAPVNGMFISLYDPERNERSCVYAWSEGSEQDVASLPPLPMSASPHSRAVATNQVIVTDDFQASISGQRVHNLGLEVDPRLPQSSLVVPMAVMGRVLGAVEVQSVDRAAYRDDHAAALRVAASLAAMAIDNVRLLSEERANRLRAEASEHRFEHVALATSDAIFDWTAWEEAIWWSEGMKTLLGHDPRSGVGTVQGWFDCILADDRERVRKDVLAALEDPRTARFSSEFRIRRGDGSHATVMASASVMRDPAGKATRMLGGLSDVTERRSLERQLMRSQRLEGLGTLAGGIAHDLNNVFTPIMMGLNLLDPAGMDEERRNVLETVRISANRGAEMVKQVLTFARGMEGQRVEVQPALVLKEFEHLVRETFPRNIDIAVEARAGTPAVLGDPTQLHQVLLNLCLNARDAMQGGGKLRIGAGAVRHTAPQRSATGEIPPGDYVQIEVEDTGCGIGEAALERIFEPFFTTKAHGEGTGLGLSMTLTIVQKHHGYIAVRSTVGKGTCFTVLLPVASSAATSGPAPNRSADVPRGSGETVLVVDDEPGIREIAARTLRRAGYEVVTARDGEDALARWRTAEKVNLVLTDLMMPVMDGEHLVRELRRLDPGVRVLCSSGLATQASAPQGERFLPKPYTAEMLLASVREALAP